MNRSARGLVLFGLLLGIGAAAVTWILASREPGSAGVLAAAAGRYFDPAFLETGDRYHRTRLIALGVRGAVILAVVWGAVLAARGGLPRGLSRIGGGRDWLARLWVLTGMYLFLAVVRLPFSVFLVDRARRYGLRHDTWGEFFADWLRGMGIGWVLVAVVGLVVLGCFARFPRWGWAGAGALVAVLSGLYALFAPLVIDPLFNRIEPMEASSLRDAVLETARRGGVEAETVWVADASRRTRAVNAYVTGFGATRRIVLYDTLVDTLPAEEVLLVVAHEAGHWRRHHLYKGLGLGVGAAMIGLFLAQGVLARWRGGRPAGHPFLVLPAYALYVTAVFVTLPVANTVSRAFEIEADRAALELTGDASTLISGKVRIAIENLSFVNPPRWVEVALYTHPCTARRIAMAEAGP